jgi:hypothetical protein
LVLSLFCRLDDRPKYRIRGDRYIRVTATWDFGHYYLTILEESGL